jgi:dextranase
MSELLPTKATFAPGESIEIEIRGSGGPESLTLMRLDSIVETVDVVPGTDLARFSPQPEGGYGVDGGVLHTAVDVLANPLARARYGFVADFAAGREVSGVIDNVRRLHLNAIQFYDWMYRHAQLLPPEGDEFVDALGRPLSLATTRLLVEELTRAGSLPLGYAAVYAAGKEEWPAWESDGLFRADGQPWTLGDDFLWNVDPTSDRWQAHFARDLQLAVANVGFAGFHLDQYGAPKYALRSDGTHVDLADAFPALITRLAAELPSSRLIFNNVNDFPTWSTAPAPQAAVYIEVWSPHERLADIARLASNARSYAPDKSVILAAYLSVYGGDERVGALEAQRLLLATAFSHGASVLLHGEEHDVLTEAYYVSHAELTDEEEDSARRYYDFAVRYGDLLFDRRAVDITDTHFGGVNEELRIDAGMPISSRLQPRGLCVRLCSLSGGLLLSLIDLSQQDDDRWDAPKRPARTLSDLRVSLERSTASAPRFLFADPDGRPALVELAAEYDGRYDTLTLPPFSTWALVWIPDAGGR